MGENSPLQRQWILLRTLTSRRCGATTRELAEELGVSEKTVRRDLETFAQVGFPLEDIVGEYGRKRWRLGGDLLQKGLPITYDEAIALHLARCFMEPLAGTIFWTAAQKAFVKIRSIFNETAWDYVQKMARAFYRTQTGWCDYSKKAEIIDQLMIGIEDRRTILLQYRSLRSRESVTYEIHPYGLTFHRGALYLVGWSPDHMEIRHWKVNRIEKADPTDRHFEMPQDFSLQDHFAKSFGVYQGDGDYHVRISFSPVVARYVTESTWHASQRLHLQRDGSVIAEFDLDALEEIARWILSFGKHAEVLEPQELRQRLREEIEEMLSNYQDVQPEVCGAPAGRSQTQIHFPLDDFPQFEPQAKPS